MASDSEIWVCPGCDGLEFDLADEGISIVHKSSRTAVILFDGRAHSLVCTTLERARRRREIEHKAMTVCPYTMDDKKQHPLEEMLDELGLGEANENQ